MSDFPRIIFYGTPDFAVASLARLTEDGFPVVAVVTAPDKPAGRGLKMTGSPVKQYAVSRGLKVLQPVSLKDPAFQEELCSLKPDLQVVVAFRMMPRQIWSLPPLGTFNLHASLLPQYRGAAPINWSVINGEKETGVTTFLLEEKIDTGKILFSERTPIGPGETAGELHDRLMEIGAGLVVKTVTAVAEGNISAISQHGLITEGMKLKPAPKFTRDDARIDWSKEVNDVFNLIRGMSPYPGAFTTITLNDGHAISVKILRASMLTDPDAAEEGTVLTDHKTFLRISAKNGYVDISEIQPSGRRVMNIREFLNGFGRMIG
ncbi:MAG TPA: methionyl-tRNA formyltransferase [Bacteroidales bacterium]|nr:methionyl-tRNA formyltransferase [Bacteroidales bacterium]HPS72725.1 methionyl-tRNA formyltransferase [Bacteroidales bacterium]